jgi:hypothetical protein
LIFLKTVEDVRSVTETASRGQRSEGSTTALAMHFDLIDTMTMHSRTPDRRRFCVRSARRMTMRASGAAD